MGLLPTLAGAQGVPPLVWQIQAHANNKRVQDISFSPNGSMLATASEDRFIKIWNAADGSQIASAIAPAPVGCVDWSPNGRWIASCSFIHESVDQGDHLVRIWDADTLSPITTLPGATADVQQVDFSPDNSLIVSAGRDGVVRLYRTSDWSFVQSYMISGWPVMDVRFTCDGSKIVALDFAGEFTVVDSQLNLLRYIPTNLHSSFSSLAISNDGRTAVGLAFNVMAWISLDSLTLIGYTNSQVSQCYAADFAQDGRSVLMAGLGGNREIEAWQPTNRTVLKMWDAQSDNRLQVVFSLASQPGYSNRFAYGNFYGQLFMARNPFVKFLQLSPPWH